MIYLPEVSRIRHEFGSKVCGGEVEAEAGAEVGAGAGVELGADLVPGMIMSLGLGDRAEITAVSDLLTLTSNVIGLSASGSREGHNDPYWHKSC